MNGRQHSPLTALFERFSLGRDNSGPMLLRGYGNLICRLTITLICAWVTT